MHKPDYLQLTDYCSKQTNTNLNELNYNYYRLIKRFKTHNHIQLSVCGKYFNTKTSKEIKLKVNGGSIGIWLDPKTFLIKSKIAENLEPIPKYKIYTNDILINL